VQIRRATLDDIGDMAALASHAQADGAGHIGYLGLDEFSIRSDVEGVDEWADRTAVAVEAGRVVGWLVAERDDEMGRVWWWGPFVDAADWQGVADRLYELARTLVPVSEEELAPDDRHRAAAGLPGAQVFGRRRRRRCCRTADRLLEPETVVCRLVPNTGRRWWFCTIGSFLAPTPLANPWSMPTIDGSF
jgi:hypothetical protein